MNRLYSVSRVSLGVCLASLVVLLVNTTSARAQQGKYVEQASANLVKLINSANADGYRLRENSLSIGGGWLKQSTSEWIKIFTVPLKPNTSFRVLAAGDSDAKDVDVEVLDANGKVMAKDGKSDPTAVADFTTGKKGGEYTVRIRLYASRSNVPCVCMAIVMTQGKSNAQGKYVEQAASTLVKLINAANADGYKLRDNKLSIGGGWLKQSTSEWIRTYSTPLKANTGYRFLAAGDKDAKDVDVEVTNSGGKVVAVDGKVDPTAVANYKTGKGGEYTIRVRLYGSQSNLPCVCLAISLTKQ